MPRLNIVPMSTDDPYGQVDPAAAFKARQQMALAMMQGSGPEPVYAPAGGAANVASRALGAWMARDNLQQEAKADQDAWSPFLKAAIDNAFGGGSDGAPAQPADPGGQGGPGASKMPSFVALQGGNASPDLKALFDQNEQKYGLPQGYLSTTAGIESNFDPNARNKSGAAGLMQFMPQTAAEYGINPMDPVQSTEGAARLAANNARMFTQALGRPPSTGELYLMHQQGGQGGIALLSNPEAPAASIVGAQAVAQNGGDPRSMTAGQFAHMWISKAGGNAPGGPSGGAPAGLPPQMAQGGQQPPMPVPGAPAGPMQMPGQPMPGQPMPGQQLAGGGGADAMAGGDTLQPSVRLPQPPDYSNIERQIKSQMQLGATMMRNQRTRAQGFKMYSDAMSGLQQLQLKKREQELQLGMKGAEFDQQNFSQSRQFGNQRYLHTPTTMEGPTGANGQKGRVQYNVDTRQWEPVAGMTSQGASFDDEKKLRDELTSKQAYKDYNSSIATWNTMVKTATRDNKMSDLNLVYGVSKVFDPGSVVREGEQILVRNAASLPDWLMGTIESVNGKAALTLQTRRNLLAEGQSRIESVRDAYESDAAQARELAKSYGANPDRVALKVPDMAVPDPKWFPDTVDPNAPRDPNAATAPAFPGAPEKKDAKGAPTIQLPPNAEPAGDGWWIVDGVKMKITPGRKKQ